MPIAAIFASYPCTARTPLAASTNPSASAPPTKCSTQTRQNVNEPTTPGASSLRVFRAQGQERTNLTKARMAAKRRLPHRRWLYTSPVMQVFVILPAAGLGTRMAGPQPKQFLALNGLPILIHSLRAFASVKRVTAIYVAVRGSEIERVQAQVAEYQLSARVRVVEGGDNRQESVSHALTA